jgi:hypothetical protein
MDDSLAALGSPIVALAVNVLTHVAVFRLRRGAHYFRSIVEGFLVGGLALAVIETALVVRSPSADRAILALLVNGPAYAALSYCYYSFVQLGHTSIRIRMYSDIAAQTAGLPVQQIEMEYGETALTQMRIRRLQESGDFVERDGRFFTGRRRLVHIANIIVGAKRLLLGRTSEFDEQQMLPPQAADRQAPDA